MALPIGPRTMSLFSLDLLRRRSEPSGMFDIWDSANSVLRENLLEHSFIAELAKVLALRHRVEFEILRSEVDNCGYDIVVAAKGILRHIQLKAMRRDGTSANVDINLKLSHKPGGCVVWMAVDRQTLELGPFKWLGGAPGADLPPLGDRVAYHSKGDAKGVKRPRPGLRNLPRGRFTRLPDMPALAEALFGPDQQTMLQQHLASRRGEPIPNDQAWLEAACHGDFSALPTLSWDNSVHLAHLIDGSMLAEQSGLGPPEDLARVLRKKAEADGYWGGSALELWIVLCAEHHRLRMEARDPDRREQVLLDELCRTLVRRLQAAH